MERIKDILDEIKESNECLTQQLEDILLPFALLSMGRTPIYNGFVPDSIEITNRDNIFVLSINNTKLAIINSHTLQASIFDGDLFPISIENVLLVYTIAEKLKYKKHIRIIQVNQSL